MSFPLSGRRYYSRIPPRAAQLGVPGSMFAVTVSASASYVNLQLLYAQPQNTSTSYGQLFNGVLGQRIVVFADGADLGIITGVAVGDVTAGNAPVLATVGTLANGVYTPAAGTCMRVPSGTSIEFEPNLTQDIFLGFVASGAGTMRIFQCSLPNA